MKVGLDGIEFCADGGDVTVPRGLLEFCLGVLLDSEFYGGTTADDAQLAIGQIRRALGQPPQ